jgi:hypothetical protein
MKGQRRVHAMNAQTIRAAINFVLFDPHLQANQNDLAPVAAVPEANVFSSLVGPTLKHVAQINVVHGKAFLGQLSFLVCGFEGYIR